MKQYKFLKKLANTKQAKLEVNKNPVKEGGNTTKFIAPQSGTISSISIWVQRIGNPKKTECEIIECESGKRVGSFFIDPELVKPDLESTEFKLNHKAILEEGKTYEIKPIKTEVVK